MIDAQGGMKPEAGVAATRPEIAPEHCRQLDAAHYEIEARGNVPIQPYSIFYSAYNQGAPK